MGLGGGGEGGGVGGLGWWRVGSLKDSIDLDSRASAPSPRIIGAPPRNIKASPPGPRSFGNPPLDYPQAQRRVMEAC